MNVAFRIALAELITFVLLFTQIVIPVITYADESAPEGASILAVGETEVIPPILTDTLTNSLSGSSPIFSTDSNRIDTVSSRDLSSESEIRGPQIDIIPTRGSSDIQTLLPANEIIIQFKPSSIDVDTTNGQHEIDAIERVQNITTTEILPDENIAVVSIVETGSHQISSFVPSTQFVTDLEKNQKIDEKITELKKDPRIEHVQRNFRYKIQGISKTSMSEKKGPYHLSTFSGRSLPNDGDFSNLWGLDNQGQIINNLTGTLDADIDYPEAMAYASGRLSNTGVIVAVLDTGIAYTHREFVGQLWDGSECVSDTGAYIGNCIHGYNFANNSRDPMDDYFIYHGTHVAGTIGAVGNNGTGVVGIAPHVRLMAVKIFDQDGSTSTISIIRGIKFATNNGAKVINASFGGVSAISRRNDFDFLTYDAIQSFPGLFVAAAGNAGTDYDGSGFKNFPSGFGSDTIISGEVIIDREIVLSGEEIIPALSNVIAVAASDQNDALASFSNYGTGSVHIAAPGVNILSTVRSRIVSSEISTVSYAGGWQKQSTGKPTNWTTRTISVVSGEIDGVTPTFSGVLWGNINTPYVSGENTYIEKTFSLQAHDINDFELGVWCDTPARDTSGNKDYLQVLISTGGLFTSILDLDEEDITQWSSLDPIYIDGHQGAYGKIDFGGLASYGVGNGPLSIRIRWHSDAIDDVEGGLSHYGCFIDNSLRLNTVEYSDGYEYLDGTSMASPHVAGAAALAMSFRPDASLMDISSSILYTGDYLSSLDGKLITPYRLNILNMLESLEIPKIIKYSHTISGESGIRITLEKGKESLSTYLSVANNKEIMSPHPDADSADGLAQSGIISRVEKENEYHLYDTPLRGEVAKFLGKLGGYSGSGGCTGTVFLDVTGALGDQCGYIEDLARDGIFSTGSLYFNPESSIDRAEEVKIILKTLGYTGSTISAGYTDTSTVDSTTLLYINQIHALGCDYYNSTEFYPTAGVSRGELYKVTACVASLSPAHITERNTSFYGYRESQNGVNELWSVSGLLEDTTYYYHVDVCTRIVCDQSGITMMFRTPKIVPLILTGSLTSTGNIYLGNSTATGAVFSGGTASGKIILINTGTNIRVELPTKNLQISASGSWDGVIKPSETYTGSNNILTTDGTITASRIENIGSDLASLTLSGQLATIEIPVVASIGGQIRIYRADRVGLLFSYIGTCTVTVSSLCRFTTDHFSAFALGTPVYPSSIGSVGGGSVSGGAGGVSVGSSYSTPDVMNGLLLTKNPVTLPKSLQPEIGPIDPGIPELFSKIQYKNKKTIILAIASGLEKNSPEEIGKYLISNIESTPSISTKLIRYTLLINHIHSEGGKQSALKKSQYEELEKILKEKKKSMSQAQ